MPWGKKSQKWYYDYGTKMASGTRRDKNPIQSAKEVKFTPKQNETTWATLSIVHPKLCFTKTACKVRFVLHRLSEAYSSALVFHKLVQSP